MVVVAAGVLVAERVAIGGPSNRADTAPWLPDVALRRAARRVPTGRSKIGHAKGEARSEAGLEVEGDGTEETPGLPDGVIRYPRAGDRPAERSWPRPRSEVDFICWDGRFHGGEEGSREGVRWRMEELLLCLGGKEFDLELTICVRTSGPVQP